MSYRRKHASIVSTRDTSQHMLHSPNDGLRQKQAKAVHAIQSLGPFEPEKVIEPKLCFYESSLHTRNLLPFNRSSRGPKIWGTKNNYI
jgi:hypothetical protein